MRVTWKRTMRVCPNARHKAESHKMKPQKRERRLISQKKEVFDVENIPFPRPAWSPLGWKLIARLCWPAVRNRHQKHDSWIRRMRTCCAKSTRHGAKAKPGESVLQAEGCEGSREAKTVEAEIHHVASVRMLLFLHIFIYHN